MKPLASQSLAVTGLLVGALWLATLTGFAQGKGAAGKTVAQNLADGAVVLATMKFGAGAAEKDNANNLLRFALKVDPENEKALLLQGKVERGLALEKVELTDGGEQYARYVLKTANTCKPETPRRLLLLKIVEIMKPGNEQALLELTKAKNNGVDVSLDWLLDNMEKGAAAKPAAGEAEAKPGGKTRAEEALRTVRLPEIVISTYSPMETVNRLNEALAGEKVSIVIQAKKLPSRMYYDSVSGVPHYYFNGSSTIRVEGSDAAQLTMTDASAEDVLKRLCRLFVLGCRYEGTKAIITDPDDPESVKNIGYMLDANDLAKELASGTKAMTKYKDQIIEIRGELTGIGRSMGRDFIGVGDKVRVVLSDKASKDDLAKLKAAHQAATESVRKSARSTYYSDGTSSSYRGDIIIFYGSGRFSGEASSKYVLKDCDSFTWRRTWRPAP